MELGSWELHIFVSLAVILGTALIALIVDYLKGSNEQLREHNIELRVRKEETERRAILDPLRYAHPSLLSAIKAAVGTKFQAEEQLAEKHSSAFGESDRIETRAVSATLVPLPLQVAEPELVVREVVAAPVESGKPILAGELLEQVIAATPGKVMGTRAVSRVVYQEVEPPLPPQAPQQEMSEPPLATAAETTETWEVAEVIRGGQAEPWWNQPEAWDEDEKPADVLAAERAEELLEADGETQDDVVFVPWTEVEEDAREAVVPAEANLLEQVDADLEDPDRVVFVTSVEVDEEQEVSSRPLLHPFEVIGCERPEIAATNGEPAALPAPELVGPVELEPVGAVAVAPVSEWASSSSSSDAIEGELAAPAAIASGEEWFGESDASVPELTLPAAFDAAEEEQIVTPEEPVASASIGEWFRESDASVPALTLSAAFDAAEEEQTATPEELVASTSTGEWFRESDASLPALALPVVIDAAEEDQPVTSEEQVASTSIGEWFRESDASVPALTLSAAFDAAEEEQTATPEELVASTSIGEWFRESDASVPALTLSAAFDAAEEDQTVTPEELVASASIGEWFRESDASVPALTLSAAFDAAEEEQTATPEELVASASIGEWFRESDVSEPALTVSAAFDAAEEEQTAAPEELVASTSTGEWFRESDVSEPELTVPAAFDASEEEQTATPEELVASASIGEWFRESDVSVPALSVSAAFDAAEEDQTVTPEEPVASASIGEWFRESDVSVPALTLSAAFDAAEEEQTLTPEEPVASTSTGEWFRESDASLPELALPVVIDAAEEDQPVTPEELVASTSIGEWFRESDALAPELIVPAAFHSADQQMVAHEEPLAIESAPAAAFVPDDDDELANTVIYASPQPAATMPEPLQPAVAPAALVTDLSIVSNSSLEQRVAEPEVPPISEFEQVAPPMNVLSIAWRRPSQRVEPILFVAPALPPSARLKPECTGDWAEVVEEVSGFATGQTAPVFGVPRTLEVPAGYVDSAALDELCRADGLFSGLVIAVAVNDYGRLEEQAGQAAIEAQLQPVIALIRGSMGDQGLACRTAEDEFVIVYPDENGPTASRRLNQVTERLWDFQLRSLGVSAIMFSSGSAEVEHERLADAIRVANEQMYQTKRNRKTVTMSFGRQKRAVNG